MALVILGAPAMACWMLSQGTLDGGATTATAIMLIGFALGVEYDLMAYLLGRYFGLRSYTINYAILYVFFSLGAGFGPPYVMRGHARLQGSYAPALTLSLRWRLSRSPRRSCFSDAIAPSMPTRQRSNLAAA